MTESYATLEELLNRITALEKEVATLRQSQRRMKLSKASLLKLESGDVVAVRIQRPLAEDERKQVAAGFRELFASIGHGDDIQAAIICSHDEINLDVIRAASHDDGSVLWEDVKKNNGLA